MLMIYGNISDLAIIFKLKAKNGTSLYYPKSLITDKEKKLNQAILNAFKFCVL